MDNVQIERRQERALAGHYEITNLGEDPVFSTYAVHSESGRTYEVWIRSLKEPANSCTCPDFKTNLVGTCKHVEAVLVHLAQTYQSELLREGHLSSPRPQVYLHYGETVQIKVARPEVSDPTWESLLSEHFDENDCFRGDPARDFGAFSASAMSSGTVDIAPEVTNHVSELRDRALRTEQRRRLQQHLAAGHSLGVTCQPLHRYQELGALHLAFGKRAWLADDPGLGKTAQAIAACELLRRERGVRRVLVICPAQGRPHWRKELIRFAACAPAVVEGDAAHRAAAYTLGAPYTIVGYDVVVRDQECLARLAPDVIILDDAQRIRNWRALTADVVKRLESPYGFVLTDSPLTHRLDDLYSVMQFVDQRMLGPLWRFNQRYYILDSARRVHGTRNLDDLKRRLAPVFLRRTATEVASELPAGLTSVHYVPVPEATRAAVRKSRRTLAKLLSRRRKLTPRLRQDLEEALEAAFSSASGVSVQRSEQAGTRCGTSPNPAGHDTDLPKVEEVLRATREILEERDGDVLVFSRWRELLDSSARRLSRDEVPFVHLAETLTSPQCSKALKQARQSGGPLVILAADRHAGAVPAEGVHCVVHLDVPLSMKHRARRTKALNWAGQESPGRSLYLVARGSLEESLLDHLDQGADPLSSVLNDKPTRTRGTAFPSVLAHADLEPLRRLLATETEDRDRAQASLFDPLPRLLPPGERPSGPAAPPIDSSPPLDRAAPTAGKRATPRQEPASEPDLLARAASKLAAARCLFRGGLLGEALEPARESMTIAARVLLCREGVVPPEAEDDWLACIYRDLVAPGRLPLELASGLSRARDLVSLSRQGGQQLVPASVVQAVVSDAEAFLRLLRAPSVLPASEPGGPHTGRPGGS